MKNQTLIGSCLMLSTILLASCASTPTTAETASTEVKPIANKVETLTIRDVKPQNQGDEVTDVRLKFLDVPMEVSLQNVKEGTWQYQLSSKQVAELTQNEGPKSHPARMTIESLNAAGGPFFRSENINITVKPLTSAGT